MQLNRDEKMFIGLVVAVFLQIPITFVVHLMLTYYAVPYLIVCTLFVLTLYVYLKLSK